MTRRAVFLDRDGVLNRAIARQGRPHPPADLEEVEICAGAPAACAALRAAGYLLIVVTNQPDPARGTTTQAAVEAINARVAAAVGIPIDQVSTCWADGHHPDRKPNPGMLLRAATQYGLDLAACWMVGDRHGDILAGQRAGCRTILIGDAWGELARGAEPTFYCPDLTAAATTILTQPGATMSDTVTPANQLKIKIWADGADKAGILDLDRNPLVSGFTTNPTLMAKAGITDYAAFARDILGTIHNKPVSFEVFTDDIADMERQARLITAWGSNLFTKIPVTNTKGESCVPLIRKLSQEGVKLNVTAILTLDQVWDVAQALRGGAEAVVSVFAGRIADTGRDPVPYMTASKAMLSIAPNAGLLWASVRELQNIYQAEQSGCAVVTVPHDILKKLSNVNRDLAEYSLDTVKMFRDDSLKAGFRL